MAEDRDGSAEDTADSESPQRPEYMVVGAPEGYDTRLAEMPTRPARVTNVELWEQIVGARVEGLNTRQEVAGLRSDFLGLRGDFTGLKEHVNDDVAALRGVIDRMDTKIDGKLSDDQLLTSLGFKLLNNQAIRWVAGAVAAGIAGTVVYQEWSSLIFRGIHHMFFPWF